MDDSDNLAGNARCRATEQRGQTADVNAIAVTTDSDAALAAISALPGARGAERRTDRAGHSRRGAAKSTLNSIIYTTLAVAAVVVGLFFALLVLEKRELFAALKALGASTGKLGRSVIVQALVASVLAVILGSVLQPGWPVWSFLRPSRRSSAPRP